MTAPEAKPRPTIKDIAQAAGVGVVTVSRALNDKPDVSEATRARILDLARQMGYRPNRHARFLKLTHNPTIALVIKGIDNPFFQQMLDTMESIVRERNHLLTVVKVPHWADEVEEAITVVDEDLMAGVIFLGGSFTHDAKIFEDLHVPFVMSTVPRLDHVPDGLYSSVSIDDRLEAARAVRHLIDLGHRRIAVLGVPSTDESIGLQRLLGYRRAMADAGLDVDEGLIRSVPHDRSDPYTYEHGYRLAQALLSERPDVTAVFAIADVIAIGAMRAIHDAGLRIPEDISVIGFDGITLGEYVEPRLTTLVQPPDVIARLTCQILFDQIESGPAQHVFIPGSIRAGASTGPARDDGARGALR
ncbi:LacI family transcriptional regulator [Actinomyces sp. B33]|uniref:LacI family DNA-binding transcriptional regulator n=1 Tax=Actinomyces sp. B33 TaxID=2942131 RepID=UPI0023417688|nr:LacI family DNA-binding transcriptional regulator [Actinomyces sp. B33]MDC4232712.1 LacI family transcriptional regulator [Actinomyces sp. B33]